MARSRIGPLAMESPLGEASGSVFRAIHVQQRMQVAVRVFSTPMGMTPEAKRSFADEMESLKTLKHPGIVRCFGGGFDARDAYLVYELVDGESLAAILSRRERLPWEMVLEYGLQLADALQFAHEKRWVHGRVRPDKILLSVDEKLAKLSDFRSDLDATGAANAPARLEDLSYRAPESFAAKYAPQAACDLYGLGAVMYHALTGRVPFTGGNFDHLKNQIIETPLTPVANLVFDSPVWLNAIVEQLLDKNPLKRPYTAAATSMALKTARDNALSGRSVAQHVAGGFSPLQMRSDRAAAEKALGIKRKRERVPKESDGTSLTDQPWFLVGGIVLAFGAIWWFTRPLSESTLRKRAEAVLLDSERRDTARDGELRELLERFPDGENAEWAKLQMKTLDMEAAEQRMERNRRFNRPPASEGERKFEEAKRFERFGDPVTALEKYRAIAELLKDVENEQPYVHLSQREAVRLEKDTTSTAAVKEFLARKLEEADGLFEKGDVVASKEIWKSIVNLYNGNQELVEFVKQAGAKLE
jgi:hypothetical protein